jgi:hypothetical protein
MKYVIKMLTSEMIDAMRFYMVWKILHCPNCKDIEVVDWEPPIYMKCTSPNGGLCKKHEKEIEEFNHKYASD